MLTPLTAMNFVAIAYTLAILLTIIVEFHPLGRFRRVSAFAALALASAGGVAWTYAAFYSHSEWPELYASQTPQDDSNHNPKRHVAGGRDEDSDTEAASGRSVTGGSRKVMAERGQASRGAFGNEASVQARLARVLGLAARPEPAAEEAIIDCEGCPPMMPVPAGTAIIGAADGDNDATEAEYPRRAVRFWPGYLISVEPVSASSFREFMAASGRRQWSCGPKMAALDAQGSELLMTTLGGSAAACVMPGDADAYAEWLSSRTGKSFRLPTAAEWEYAARTLPAGTMAMGGVAELVGDCWHPQIPTFRTEKIASETGVMDCDGRMLKGGAAAEEARWHRPSARRHIGGRETDPTIGFRVMRRQDIQK